MGYKKRPTKSDLYDRIERLEKQNRALSDELEKEQRVKWESLIPDATAWMTDFLNKTFPRTWCKLRFEHVDAAAYWYTFELVNDDRRQTWCVRHSDLEG
jgi:hypothetical protein